MSLPNGDADFQTLFRFRKINLRAVQSPGTESGMGMGMVNVPPLRSMRSRKGRLQVTFLCIPKAGWTLSRRLAGIPSILRSIHGNHFVTSQGSRYSRHCNTRNGTEYRIQTCIPLIDETVQTGCDWRFNILPLMGGVPM